MISQRNALYHLEDQENINRLNNIHIRGLSEVTKDDNMPDTVWVIFNTVLG